MLHDDLADRSRTSHTPHPTCTHTPHRIHLTFFLDLHLYAVIWTFYKIFIDIVVQFWLIASHSPLFLLLYHY